MNRFMDFRANLLIDRLYNIQRPSSSKKGTNERGTKVTVKPINRKKLKKMIIKKDKNEWKEPTDYEWNGKTWSIERL